MHYLFPTTFILTALSASIHAKPTSTTPSPVTKVLVARETYVNQIPTSGVRISLYSDGSCQTATAIYTLTYDKQLRAQFRGISLSRDLMEGEQIDFSTAGCAEYIGSPVVGSIGPALATGGMTGDEKPPKGNQCYPVPASASGGCIKLWHHSLNGQS